MPADWLTVDDVAAYGDIIGDPLTNDNLVLSTATVKAAVERRRSDLWTAADPPDFAPDDEVKGGAVMWANAMYQARTMTGDTPGAEGSYYENPWNARITEAKRLCGWRLPVAY